MTKRDAAVLADFGLSEIMNHEQTSAGQASAENARRETGESPKPVPAEPAPIWLADCGLPGEPVDEENFNLKRQLAEEREDAKRPRLSSCL